MDIQLFDKKAQWIEPDPSVVASFGDDERQRFTALRDAVKALQSADAAVEAKRADISRIVGELADAENYLKERFPAPDFISVWRDAIAQRRADIGH